MKKGVYALVFLFFAGIVVMLAVGVLSILDLWKKHIGISQIYFWAGTAILLVNMFYTVFNIKSVTVKPFKEIMIFLSAVTFIVLMYTSAVMVIKYIVGLILGAFLKPANPLLRFIKETAVTLPVILSVTCIVGIIGYIRMGMVQTVEYEIDVPKASQNRELVAAVIADTHIGIGAHKGDIDEIVERINAIEPDVVFLLGDIFDENTTVDEMEYFSEKFKEVKSRYGAFFVIGNHEVMQGGDIEHYFTDAGVTVLTDEAEVIAGDITIVGMDSEYGTSGDPIGRIMEQKKVDTAKPVIVLKHEPLGIKDIAAAGADVSMHGHTHGEQFPFTYLPFSLMNDMMDGTKKFGALTAFTTQGAAGWGFHFKLPAKSEVAKVTLKFGGKS